ncbi:hypothetical protein D9V84_09795 [Bacteroidetes/Chlorobi group bacterium Naka2016]|nr:MAG: hypothetical protein D9V84_09795 [Bacteroidetes/Chlorobi group bacterium Naka2016]
MITDYLLFYSVLEVEIYIKIYNKANEISAIPFKMLKSIFKCFSSALFTMNVKSRDDGILFSIYIFRIIIIFCHT